MKRAIRPFLLLAGLAIVLVVCGCSGKDKSPTNPLGIGGENSATSTTNTKPEALTRANYLRLDQGLAEDELKEIFGPPQEVGEESKETRKYTWKSGTTKLEVHVKNSKVVASWYPGEHEERGKRLAAHLAGRALIDLLRKHALKNRNRFPDRLEDLDLGNLAKDPATMAVLKRGDVGVPWGKSANRLVWAYWKDTPEFGGPYVRFDGKDFAMVSPQEFARQNATVLTADTIPADIVAQSKPGRSEPTTLVAQERKGIGAQGFFTAGVLAPLLVTRPASLGEVAKHMVRDYWHVEALRLVEKGEIVVRWGRDPRQGVYAYPRGFPRVGDPGGWAIYKGQWAPFERLEEAKKAFDE